MKKASMPFGAAIFLLIAGIFLGSVFTFGMQRANADAARSDCIAVETRFLAYDEIHQAKRPASIKEIAVDCANEERYFIDGVCINTELRSTLSELSAGDAISMLIHPNSNTIVELSTEANNILEFDDTMGKLKGEATGFLFLGLFMYLCALIGLYHVAWHGMKKYRTVK